MAITKAKLNFYSEVAEVLQRVALVVSDCSYFTEYQIHSPVGSVNILVTKEGEDFIFSE